MFTERTQVVGLSQLKTHNALSIILLAPVEQSRKNPVSMQREESRGEQQRPLSEHKRHVVC